MARALGLAGAELVLTARRQQELADAAAALQREGMTCMTLPPISQPP